MAFLFTAAQGQKKSSEDYKLLLDSAKTLFNGERKLNQEDLDRFDYHRLISLFEKVIELKPDHAEARYFLAYAYSRLNSRDGRGLIDMNLDLVFKCSEQLEKVIELSPKYTGDIVVLDPYSKLTAEWGSMAMSYWNNHKSDSAIWAFLEGKRRGGFGPYIIELNKNVLDACSAGSILMSSGDNFSIPLWYLQIVEKYRTDVSVIDVNLLNTLWYPTFLCKTNAVLFDLSCEDLDTVEYLPWTDKPISIQNFTWIVKPSYYEQYLLRGDRIFLSMLKGNDFERELFFTLGFSEENRLSLTNYLSPRIFVDKLSVLKPSNLTNAEYTTMIQKALRLSLKLNVNSSDEIRFLDNFRFQIFKKVDECLNSGQMKLARELMALLDQYKDEQKYPCQSDYVGQYERYLKEKMK